MKGTEMPEGDKYQGGEDDYRNLDPKLRDKLFQANRMIEGQMGDNWVISQTVIKMANERLAAGAFDQKIEAKINEINDKLKNVTTGQSVEEHLLDMIGPDFKKDPGFQQAEALTSDRAEEMVIADCLVEDNRVADDLIGFDLISKGEPYIQEGRAFRVMISKSKTPGFVIVEKEELGFSPDGKPNNLSVLGSEISIRRAKPEEQP